MISKKFLILYHKGKSNRIIDEISVEGSDDEECFASACQYVSSHFKAEEINPKEEQSAS